jgi:hypothetical protein
MGRIYNSYHSLYASLTIALGLCALLLSACNGPAASSSPPGMIPARSKVPSPATTGTPIPFTFITVDDPNSNTNMVTGINQLAKVVGTFGGGSASNIAESYDSVPPYTRFLGLNYPGAQGTVATSLTSNKTIAGYVISPQQLSGTWAFVRTNGVWALMKNHKEGSGTSAVTEILGINDSKLAVGFFLNTAGVSVPFVLDTATEQFTSLNPPNAIGAVATGINGKGNISGTETLSGGAQIGYYLQTGTYYQIAYPKALMTQVLSLNWQDQVVGEYEDAGGIHGFLLDNPTSGGGARQWQSVDEPNAVGATVITGIDNHDDICGWYIDSAGHVNGFVANPKVGK